MYFFAIFKIVLEFFLVVLFSFFCPLPSWIDCCPSYYVWIHLPSFVYLLYYRFLAYDYHEVYILQSISIPVSLYINHSLSILCVIILTCWSLNFKSMLTTLYFYHSLPIDCVWYHILHVLFCESLNYLLWTEMILFLLPFNLPTSFIHDWLTTFTEYLLYQWYFSFHNFHFFCSDLFFSYLEKSF